jgi:hypothetical protein
MLEAILIKKGRKLKVFILSINGDMEIQRFLNECDSEPLLRGTIRGFGALINHICEHGLERLTQNMADCWPEQRELFCEMKKGPHRISYFRYPGGKVLLISHFIKHRDVEQAEYDRALRLKYRFDAAPVWRE